MMVCSSSVNIFPVFAADFRTVSSSSGFSVCMLITSALTPFLPRISATSTAVFSILPVEMRVRSLPPLTRMALPSSNSGGFW